MTHVSWRDFNSEVNGIRLRTTLVQCEECGHIFNNPQPTWRKSPLSTVPAPGTKSRIPQTESHFKAVDQMIVSRMDTASGRLDHVPVILGGRFLDVGSGKGFMLAAMQRLGMEAEGIEPRSDAVAQCQAAGLKVRCGTLHDVHFPSYTFDCMNLTHVLEHVPDPVDLLSECRRILKSGGELVVSVPNFRSLVFGIVGWGWLGIDPPCHLHQFTIETLRLAGERAGFRVEDVCSESNCEFVEMDSPASCEPRYAYR